MRILLVVGSLNQGGAEFQLLSLARLLQSKGHKIEVLALTDYSYFLPYIKEHEIMYSCVTNEGNSFQRLKRAVRQINDKKPDLVISYIKRVSQVAILARALSGFKFKLIISERTSLIKPRHDLFYFNLALLANKITVNATSKLGYINKRFPYLKKRTIFIPNIINIEKFLRLTPVTNNTGKLRLAFVGRISPEKNILNLINAVKIIVDKGFSLQLSLIGASNNNIYMQEVSDLINKSNLGDSVKYLGPTKNVNEVYRNTDLLCLVSFYEGFSNVLSEAISCGIPVLASDIDENRFLVDDGINGFLVNPEDAVDIATGIEKFIRLSKSDIEKISHQNRNKAQEIFDEENIYNKYRVIFKEIGFAE